MSVLLTPETSLRADRAELKRLTWALIISLALHGTGVGGYVAGRKLFPGLVNRLQELAARLIPTPTIPKKQPTETEPPLVFVDVNPQAATPEPPKDPKFYSNRNSQAANPDADQETAVPKITGTQTEVVKAEDVPRVNLDKLQPDFSQPEPPKPQTPSGDLAMAKPDVTLRPEQKQEEQSRPRNLTEARMRLQQRNQLVGEKMKQDGGTRRVRLQASFDARATPFGAYDTAFIEAVQQHWFDLLDNSNYSFGRSGRVVLQFHLNYDGRITDMKVLEENVGGMLSLLCQKAVQDPSPFEKWPREMRLMTDKDYREVKFVFYYN
jgi:hypothetical protein